MIDNGPRYDWAARAAAEIVNLHVGSDEPKALIYGRILFVILTAIYESEEELKRRHYEPSDN